jgi:hypothetical protein
MALVEKTTNEFTCYSHVEYSKSGIWKGTKMILAIPMAFSNVIGVYVRQQSRGFTTSPPLSHHFQHMRPPITLSEVHSKLI